MRSLFERQIRSGPVFYIVREGQQVGYESGYKNSGDRTIVFRPNVDVRIGDWLVIVTTEGAEYYVVDTDPMPDVGFGSAPLGLKTRYLTRRDYDKEESGSLPPPPSITFGDFHGNPNINTGTQRDVYIAGDHTFDFRSIEQEIAQSGAPESEELLAAVRELRTHLENAEPLRPGMLARVSEAAQKYSWFSTHLGKALVDWLLALPRG